MAVQDHRLGHLPVDPVVLRDPPPSVVGAGGPEGARPGTLTPERAATRSRPLLGQLVAAYIALGAGAVALATLVFRPLFPAIDLPVSPFGMDPGLAGLLLWTGICLATSNQGTPGTGQVRFVFSTGPVMAAGLLGGPAAAAWVALIGTTQLRDLRGRTPWSLVLANHGLRTLAATIAATMMLLVRSLPIEPFQVLSLVAILVGTIVMLVIEEGLGLLLWRTRTGRRLSDGFDVVSRGDWNLAAIAEGCLAWLAAVVYRGGLWWAPVVLIVADVAASRSMAHHQASWRLRHNDKTNLPSRAALDAYWLALPRGGPQPPMCSFYLDLDGFKAVNDEHGHHVGDDVLLEVGRRLDTVACADVFVAHLHGDEFFVLASGIGDESTANRLADRLRSVIEPPIPHEGAELKISATVGVHLLPPRGSTGGAMDELEDAMKRADEMMSKLKDRTRRRGDHDRREAAPGSVRVPDHAR